MSNDTDEATVGRPRPVPVSVWITLGVVLAVLISLWQAIIVEPHRADSPPAPDTATVEVGAPASQP